MSKNTRNGRSVLEIPNSYHLTGLRRLGSLQKFETYREGKAMKEPYGIDDSPSSSASADVGIVPVDDASTEENAEEKLAGAERSHTSRQSSKPSKLERSRSDMVSPFGGGTLDSGGGSPRFAGSSTPSSVSSCEFATPSRRLVRPNSPVVISGHLSLPSSGVLRPMAVPARGRIATIRRESDCAATEQKNRETEAAHERLVKASQQVSLGFEDFCLDEKLFDERKRAKSLTEPISILTSAFLIPPTSCSPSPTRSLAADSSQKQCYSPSTGAMQVVRGNLSYYSPSPSPTPSTPNSPNRNRIMRSMSPIAARQISKRRHTAGSGNNSGRESDGESSLGGYPPPQKRQCHYQLLSSSSSSSCVQRSAAASPLIRDPLSSTNIRICSSSFTASNPPDTCLVNTTITRTGLADATLLLPSIAASLNNTDNNSSTTSSSRADSPNTTAEGEEESEMDVSADRRSLKDLETTGEGGSGLSISSIDGESSFNSES